MANRSKVFLIVTKANFGGAQRYVYDVARSLPREQYDVTVVTGAHGWLQEACTEASVRSVTLPSLQRDISFFKDLSVFGELTSLLKQEKPDILHLNSSKIGALGALAGRRAGIKRIIFTAHGWAFNEKRSVFARVFFWVAHAITMLLCDLTLANSEATARSAPFHFRLKTVRLGMDEPVFISKEEARKELNIGSDLAIGTIAELHKNKGLDILIEAIAGVPNAKAVIIGDGEEKDSLLKRAEKAGVSGQISFLGHIDNAARYLHAFDIFALPSRTESLSYAILEAGVAGLPVVASNVGGIPEIISDNETGLLVPSENPDLLKSALATIMADESLRRKLGSALRVKVLNEFSLKKMIAEIENAYATPTSS